jgi:hypothetical protein
MNKVGGGCHCGNITVDLELTAEFATYHPRVCDCDFCRKHGAAWLSDTKGSLLIKIKNTRESNRYRQGSGQAEFLLCKHCGVMVAVLYEVNQKVYATVNMRGLDGAAMFGPEQTVSPQQLSASEKANRWQGLWFPNVTVASSRSD